MAIETTTVGMLISCSWVLGAWVLLRTSYLQRRREASVAVFNLSFGGALTALIMALIFYQR